MIRNEVIMSLKALAKDLNSTKIRWSLGASLMLALKGIECTVDDIDIVVHNDDYENLLEFLKNYDYTYQEPNLKYCTKHFYSLVINGVDVDIMVDFRIKTNNTIYKYPFHVDQIINIDNIEIPLASLDEWLTAYIHMGRDLKVKMISEYQQNKKA